MDVLNKHMIWTFFIFTSVPGIESFANAAASAMRMELNGVPVKALSLPALISSKEAAADPNPRKQSALAFLKALQKTKNAG
jgi:hypothetical protein